MHSEIFHSEVIAVFIARVFLGLVFVFQGFDAVFRIGVKSVINTAYAPLANKGIPRFFIASGSFYTSYVQLIAGAFLTVGLFKYCALYLLGIDLLLAATVFGIVTPVWDMRHVFPRLAILIFLLVVPSMWDSLSLDYFRASHEFMNVFTN
jgi:uncharacterized membrane protein YphA (DoxX/SURF4 family)